MAKSVVNTLPVRSDENEQLFLLVIGSLVVAFILRVDVVEERAGTHSIRTSALQTRIFLYSIFLA